MREENQLIVANCTIKRPALCRHRPELWPTVGYMKLYVDTDLNCGLELVT